jgi:uncharacterized metal-binding protein
MSFLYSLQYKKIGLRFCMLIDYIAKLCPDLFSVFLGLISVIFEERKIKSPVLGSQKSSLQ